MEKESNDLHLYIEALIFSAEVALSIEEICAAINASFEQRFENEHIQKQVDIIIEKYDQPNFAINLMPIAKGYLFMTKEKYHKIVGDYLRLTEKKRLSKAALETLSIIAYKQPITKSEMEAVRGVNCDYTVQKLLEKDLVEIAGRQEGPGRPLLYNTSTKFLDHFGIQDHKDLPQLKEFESVENSIGSIETADHGTDTGE